MFFHESLVGNDGRKAKKIHGLFQGLLVSLYLRSFHDDCMREKNIESKIPICRLNTLVLPTILTPSVKQGTLKGVSEKIELRVWDELL